MATRGSQPAGATAAIVNPAQATVWGLARTIFQQEHTELAGGIVDLDPKSTVGELETLTRIFTGDGPIEDQMAVREGRVLVPRLQASRQLGQGWQMPRIEPNRTYLVTGGLGDPGNLCARWLAKHGARRLILMSRTALPQRTAWDQVDPQTRVGRAVVAVRELELLGVDVHLAAVNIGNERAVRDYLATYRRQGWPPIGGVIHAAGITASELVERMSAQTFSDTIRAKVAGGLALHRQTLDEPLGFFTLFSSQNTWGFTAGAGAYAAGNAFLDSFAHLRRQQGLPAISINWGA